MIVFEGDDLQIGPALFRVVAGLLLCAERSQWDAEKIGQPGGFV